MLSLFIATALEELTLNWRRVENIVQQTRNAMLFMSNIQSFWVISSEPVAWEQTEAYTAADDFVQQNNKKNGTEKEKKEQYGRG